jgi:hypothetical protein
MYKYISMFIFWAIERKWSNQARSGPTFSLSPLVQLARTATV